MLTYCRSWLGRDSILLIRDSNVGSVANYFDCWFVLLQGYHRFFIVFGLLLMSVGFLIIGIPFYMGYT